jgi:hypothetical protein
MSLIFLILMTIHVIPFILLPIGMNLIESLWGSLSSVLQIGNNPNYILKDIMFPSLLMGMTLIGVGHAANNMIQTV